MATVKPGTNYTSPSGRKWKWCRIWECWHYRNWTYKIHFHPKHGDFNCSSYGVWHEGLYKTFEDAEKELLGGKQ